MNYDNSNMVLRYHIPLENHQERFNLLCDFLKRTGIHRVILFSSCFLEESAFFPLSYYEQHAKMLEQYFPVLKDMGIETGINVLNTVGHIYYADDGEFSFRRAVSENGETSMQTACMLDENLHRYIEKQYSFYARLFPDTIFLDDDVRNNRLGKLSCFCDHHLAKLSERVGRAVTREEAKASLFTEQFDGNRIKTALLDLYKEDVLCITKVAAEAVHKISPDTRVGIMTTDFPDITFDKDMSKFFKSAKSFGVDMVRTGINFYREGELKSIPVRFSNPLIQRNHINDTDIEIQPEIENDTYGLFYKSRAVTHLQTVFCLASGFRNMQLNLFDMIDKVIPDFDAVTDSFTENMEYYNAISSLIPVNSKPSGIGIYKSPNSLLYRRAKEGRLFYENDWYGWLSLDGLPIGYDWGTTPFLFLTGDDILGAEKDELESILLRGAVIDLRAAECLVHMGCGERIGIESLKDIETDFAGERFLDEPENGEFQGYHNSNYFHSGLLSKRNVADIRYRAGARELSSIINHHKKRVAAGVTLFENNNGERFCILPIEHGLFQQFINVNYKRKTQLINVFQWIARNELPVVSLHPNVTVTFHDFSQRNVISLFNLTTDTLYEVCLSYKEKEDLLILGRNGKLQKAEFGRNGDMLTIKAEIPAAGCIVLIDEKGKA